MANSEVDRSPFGAAACRRVAPLRLWQDGTRVKGLTLTLRFRRVRPQGGPVSGGMRAGTPGYGGAVKVPAVKPYFWAVKLLTTAMGEAVSDFLVNDVNKYLAVVVGFLVFVVAIVWQFRTPQYRTWPYWTAVAMVAVFGTMCADVMHIVLGAAVHGVGRRSTRSA